MMRGKSSTSRELRMTPKHITSNQIHRGGFFREEKSIHHHRGDPPFFLFPGLRLCGVYPSFRTYGVYPFPLFSQENGIHHSFFCSVTSGSGDRPRKGGPAVVVYTLFSPVFPGPRAHSPYFSKGSPHKLQSR